MNRIKYCVAGSLLAASMLALTGCGSYDVNIRVEPIPAEEVADNDENESKNIPGRNAS